MTDSPPPVDKADEPIPEGYNLRDFKMEWFYLDPHTIRVWVTHLYSDACAKAEAPSWSEAKELAWKKMRKLLFDRDAAADPAADNPPPVDKAEEILKQAQAIVAGARQEAYGTPEQNFGVIAEFWSTYLSRAHNDTITITPDQVAAMIALLKVARMATTPTHTDSVRDLIGYAACYARCADVDLSK